MEYKVIALSVSGRGNKIFRAGDIVTENNFPEGNAARLVHEGFIKPVGKLPKPIEFSVKSEEEFAKPIDKMQPEIRAYEDITVKELREITGISDPKKKKAALYEAYEKALK
jgi:hypothetical protein